MAITIVDEYIGQFEGDVKARLFTLRDIITAEAPEAPEAPEAEEGMMYGLVGYKLRKKPLVYFGGFARHIGFYATPQGHAEFADDLAKYKQGKGSVQFPLDQPLPTELVRRMVRHNKQKLES